MFTYDAKDFYYTFYIKIEKKKYEIKTELAVKNMTERLNKTIIFLVT